MKNDAKIDSFSLLIPLEKVDVIDGKFLKSYVKVYESTGEIEESPDFCKFVHVNESKGIKYKIAKVNRVSKGKVQREYVQIVLTSKMAKKGYFNGINSSNIDAIFDSIRSMNVIDFSNEVAINSLCTDVDICRDFTTTPEEYKQQNDLIKQLVPVTKHKYIQSFQNGNIQFNERQKATPTAPFVKIYYKTEELLIKSLEFTQAYLDGQDYTNLQRFEINIKGYKQRQRYDLRYKTLLDLLSYTKEELNKIHTFVMLEYFTKKIVMKNKHEFTPAQIKELNYIDELIRLGLSTDHIIYVATQGLQEKAKYRAKKQTIELLEYVQQPTKLASKNKELKSINNRFKLLGIYD